MSDEKEFGIESIELPVSVSEDVQKVVVASQYRYSVWGLVLGLACVICGAVLFFHGVAGHSSWTVEVLGLSSKLSDAAPGVILFVVGLFVVYITRFEVKIQKKE